MSTGKHSQNLEILGNLEFLTRKKKRTYGHLNVSLRVCVCVLEEGWSQCKERPPCSEKDYFQTHTACDSDGKVGYNAECVLLYITTCVDNLFTFTLLYYLRPRSCTGGWNLRCVWKMWPVLWHCPLLERKRTVHPAIQASTCTTLPPVYLALKALILMAPQV